MQRRCGILRRNPRCNGSFPVHVRRPNIRFDGWALHKDLGELAKNGRRILLQDQPLQVLDELLSHPGELVTREQLIARLWPKVVVDFDTGLNSAVRKLRIALGDVAETPRYIETVPRRGYRFIGTIDPPVMDAASRARRCYRGPIAIRGARRLRVCRRSDNGSRCGAADFAARVFAASRPQSLNTRAGHRSGASARSLAVLPLHTPPTTPSARQA
jgi:DNA-binding winged helix-turn-helix (wHTH) protein